jgi:hypothetical protein
MSEFVLQFMCPVPPEICFLSQSSRVIRRRCSGGTNWPRRVLCSLLSWLRVRSKARSRDASYRRSRSNLVDSGIPLHRVSILDSIEAKFSKSFAIWLIREISMVYCIDLRPRAPTPVSAIPAPVEPFCLPR